MGLGEFVCFVVCVWWGVVCCLDVSGYGMERWLGICGWVGVFDIGVCYVGVG